MAVGNRTLGVMLKYVVETTAGTKPSFSGATQIKGIKTIPDIGAEASAIDVTELEEKNFRQYIPGLKDTGGILSFTANNTDAVQTAWNTAVTAYNGLTGGKAMWWEVSIPNVTNKFYFTGQPVANGLTAMGVNEAADLTLNIACDKVSGWASS